MAEDTSAIVGVTLRIREDLRRSLEEAAKARRVSLNQEIIDRLEYVRDRRSLLAEVLRLTFGDRLAGLLLAIGLAMSGVVYGFRRLSSDARNVQSHESWIDDHVFFDDAAQAALVILAAAQPERAELRHNRQDAGIGWLKAYQVLDAMGDHPHIPSHPSAREIGAIKDLLGPVADRMSWPTKDPNYSLTAAIKELTVALTSIRNTEAIAQRTKKRLGIKPDE